MMMKETSRMYSVLRYPKLPINKVSQSLKVSRDSVVKVTHAHQTLTPYQHVLGTMLCKLSDNPYYDSLNLGLPIQFSFLIG